LFNNHALTSAHPARVVALQLDVTDAAQVAEAASVAGDVDLLVNNAGIATGLGLSIADPAVIDGAMAEMDVNYFGLLRVTQAFAPALAANGGGSIVNLSSVVGLTAFAPFVSYSASRRAFSTSTRAPSPKTSDRVSRRAPRPSVLASSPGLSWAPHMPILFPTEGR
jgi:NAD(P)-dependent dehydrogenase (short-subunit alcohol dehydrogenase family)